MTVTVSIENAAGHIWTIDDLHDLPDDGRRYEIVDGSLLVSPAPKVGHGRINERLRHVLEHQCPAGLHVLAVGLGIDIGRRRTYYVPDLMIVRDSALADADADNVAPAGVLLVAEVLSRSNAGFDLVQKRHDYAAAGIPRYWIVDPRDETITVLALRGGKAVYEEEAVVKAAWTTDLPYRLAVDPAEIF